MCGFSTAHMYARTLEKECASRSHRDHRRPNNAHTDKSQARTRDEDLSLRERAQIVTVAGWLVGLALTCSPIGVGDCVGWISISTTCARVTGLFNAML